MAEPGKVGNIPVNELREVQDLAKAVNRTIDDVDKKFESVADSVKSVSERLQTTTDLQVNSGKRAQDLARHYQTVLNFVNKQNLGSKIGLALSTLILKFKNNISDADKEQVDALNKQVGAINLVKNFAEKLKKQLSDSQTYINASNAALAGAASLFAGLVTVAFKFASELDSVGKQFGSLVNLGPDLTNDLLDSGVEARKLGQGIAETSSVTSDLASNFGISLDNATGLSNKILDTAMATGLSNEEATNLFGTLGQVLGLSQQQSEALIEGTAQLARQAGVAPQQVLKDIAASSETIATFTKAGGENLFEAAIAARQFGLNIDSVAKAARSTLDFESSINAEVEASVLLGQNINLQRARQLALSKDLVGFQQEIKNQLGGINDFTELNVFQQESLAKAVGMSVSEVSKLVSGTEKLSLSGALAAGNFEDLLGSDGLSTLSQISNEIKSLGAELVRGLGPTIEMLLNNFKNFIEKGDGLETIKGIIEGVGSAFAFVANNLPTVIGLMVTLRSVTIGAAIAQALLGVNKVAAVSLGIGIPVFLGMLAAGVAGAMTMFPKAQTGITGFGGGPLMVGESGPEIMNVPRGTSVMSAEPTRQLLNGGGNEKVEGTLSRIENALLAANNQRGNMKLTAGRGTLTAAIDENLGGPSLTMG